MIWSDSTPRYPRLSSRANLYPKLASLRSNLLPYSLINRTNPIYTTLQIYFAIISSRAMLNAWNVRRSLRKATCQSIVDERSPL